MSDPPNTSSIVLLDPHHHHHHPLHLSTAAAAPSAATPSFSSVQREYRKGNWTVHETMVLITAKQMDDERRARSTTSESKQSYKTAELRWKWVENYCWDHGCFRSQNQCNDKWDNLLRDYKKVRDYEAGAPSSDDRPTYWQMEKHERKERNLPTNLLIDVFQALHDVVSRRLLQRSSAPDAPTPVISRPTHPPPHPPVPPRPLPPPPQPPGQSPLSAEMSDSSETEEEEEEEEGGEGSERVDSDTKRRRVRNVGSSVVRSAKLLARTLLACEEKKEKRHQGVLELEERRLLAAENRNEVNRQGIDGLVSAVNNLSSAIHALVSNRNDTR